MAATSEVPGTQAFVLGQHDIYGLLAGQVRAIRRRLDGGDDLADVLVRETREILDSAMTREQIASALVSVMVRVAQGEDLLAASAEVDPLVQAGGSPFSVRRGGIRWPVSDTSGADEPCDDPGWASDEVRWDEYSTGGPPSSSRLTHIPTGIVVVGEGGRSVTENRRCAEALLRARLAERLGDTSEQGTA